MKKWNVSKNRKREVYYKDISFLKFFTKRIFVVVYWNVNDAHGLMWDLTLDRIGYPKSVSAYYLAVSRWELL